jgi:hypothetical protein
MLEFIKAIPGYLFEKSPGQAFSYYTAMLVLIALLIASSFIFKSIHKKRVQNHDFVFKKMFKKIPVRLVYFAIGLLFFLAVRYENIPYFSMRLWLILILLGFLAMLGYYLYKYLKVYPKERDNFESRPKVDATSKYLPNK